MPFAHQKQLDMIFRIAERIGAVHGADNLFRVGVTVELNRLVKRMRTRVQEFAGAHVLNGLPVPAASETVVGDFDHDDASEDAGAHDLQALAEQRAETGLLEYGEEFSCAFCRLRNFIDIRHMACKRFFTDDVMPCFHRLDADGDMIHASGRIDDQVNALILEHLFVVAVFFEFRGRRHAFDFAAFRDIIRYGDDFKTRFELFLSFKQVTVDIASAASLSDDSDSDSLHFKSF